MAILIAVLGSCNAELLLCMYLVPAMCYDINNKPWPCLFARFISGTDVKFELGSAASWCTIQCPLSHQNTLELHELQGANTDPDFVNSAHS